MGEKTLNDIFYKPDIGASGAVEKGKFDDGLDVADGFIIANKSGIGNLVVSNWTIRVSAEDNDWRSVCWSPELGLFAAVATTGVGNRVMTSPNGIDWTIRVSAADVGWLSVCWSPELGLFVATAYSGTGNRVMTSLFYK